MPTALLHMGDGMIEDEIQKILEEFELPSGDLITFVDYRIPDGEAISCNPTLKLSEYHSLGSNFKPRMMKRIISSLTSQIAYYQKNRSIIPARGLLATKVKCEAADEPKLLRLGWIVSLVVR